MIYHLQVDTGQVQVVQRSTSGLLVKTWNLGAVGSFGGFDPAVLAVSPNGTIAYYAGLDEIVIHRWDLVNNVGLTNFVTGVPTLGVTVNSMFTLSTGDVIIGWGATNGLVGSIIRYSSAAAVLTTYTTSKRPMAITPGLTDAVFWTCLFDGSVIEFNTVAATTAQSWSISAWSPFCVLRVSILDLGTPGTIQTPNYWIAIKRTLA